ncbi:MAG: RdgB/HAM1 family non-canonical purine NTP pyrophosphatase [Bryobacterales bacterium]|nr:RdgB/HAM1 family non-canonical purine NTP pyrophosphatase [Bryobacterales bacterium]
MTLRCATSNPGKLREFTRTAERFGWQVEPVHGIPPCEEDGATFLENARKKAQYYSSRVPGLVFAEDSGLEVTALGGAPGVYSARFAGEGATDADNNRLLIERLAGTGDRSARYVAQIVLADTGRIVGEFEGHVSGLIVDEPRGANGFGYDPHFFYEPFGCTFGEAPLERKMDVSHRTRALEAMFESLNARR